MKKDEKSEEKRQKCLKFVYNIYEGGNKVQWFLGSGVLMSYFQSVKM